MSSTRLIKTISYVILGLLLGMMDQKTRAGTLGEADRLLECPTPIKVSRALNIYQEHLPQPGSERFPLLVGLARSSYIMGEVADETQRKDYFEKGRFYAEKLLQERPDSVEGHYWLALNLAGIAEMSWSDGMVLLPQILQELERAMALDSSYDQAGPHRVLGRIYYEAPDWPLSVGDPYKSLNHLKAATDLAPNNTTNHLFLAETMIRLRLPAQAKVELEKVLVADQHAICKQGIEDDRQRASLLLQNSFAKVDEPED
ncbi:MAG: TRAP transporter TatT component family protein [Desulfobacca sp.]|nr:TRAP transporter TatT component family protein [Desulfobacca sp.]